MFTGASQTRGTIWALRYQDDDDSAPRCPLSAEDTGIGRHCHRSMPPVKRGTETLSSQRRAAGRRGALVPAGRHDRVSGAAGCPSETEPAPETAGGVEGSPWPAVRLGKQRRQVGDGEGCAGDLAMLPEGSKVPSEACRRFVGGRLRRRGGGAEGGRAGCRESG